MCACLSAINSIVCVSLLFINTLLHITMALYQYDALLQSTFYGDPVETLRLNVNYSVNTLQLGINSFNHRILDGRSEEC